MVFVLDMSGSIGASNWKLMLDIVVNIIQKLTVSQKGTHVGLVTFSDQSAIQFLLDEYYSKPALIAAVRGIQYVGGSTNTASGILRMKDFVFDQSGRGLRGDRTNVSNVAIVITDGGSNIDSHKTIPYAVEAKDMDIQMLVIGITQNVNETELQGISNDGVRGSTYWMSDDFNVTDVILETVISQTCNISEPGKIL